MFVVRRSEANPLISPSSQRPWEAHSTFNWSPVKSWNKVYVAYRAMSELDPLENNRQTSIIARAESRDGEHFTHREQFIVPDRYFDKYGCEDPRITKIDGKYYIFYTALSNYPFSAEGIKIAVAISKDMKTVEEKHLVTPFNAKAMTLFPEKINGKYCALLTVNTDLPPSKIALAEFDSLEEMWSPVFWDEWYANIDSHLINLKRGNDDQVEIGAQPLKTKDGWLVIYSHIYNYYSNSQIFGIEAVLMDLNDPKKIIGRSNGPFMVPEEHYEKLGQINNIIFPSGALIEGKNVCIYHGTADTHCAKAYVSLEHLIKSIKYDSEPSAKRFEGNPIISPREGKDWEAGGTLNAAIIDLDKKIHILYRAATLKNVSTIGYASSKDGFHIDERPDEPIYKARESFEGIGRDEGAGCEDSRIVEIEGRLYMTYTGFDGNVPRIVVSSITKQDFIEKKWDKWSKPSVISEPGIPNKDCIIIPEKIKGKYYIFHRVGVNICADTFESLNFEENKIDECIEVMMPRKGMWDGKKLGMAGPAIKTKKGWIAFYHGISGNGTYSVGAMLLDLKNPTVILARTADPILEPKEPFELKGIVNNVVFPCGTAVRKNTIYMYYGAADKVLGVATIDLKELLKALIS